MYVASIFLSYFYPHAYAISVFSPFISLLSFFNHVIHDIFLVSPYLSSITFALQKVWIYFLSFLNVGDIFLYQTKSGDVTNK